MGHTVGTDVLRINHIFGMTRTLPRFEDLRQKITRDSAVFEKRSSNKKKKVSQGKRILEQIAVFHIYV